MLGLFKCLISCCSRSFKNVASGPRATDVDVGGGFAAAPSCGWVLDMGSVRLAFSPVFSLTTRGTVLFFVLVLAGILFIDSQSNIARADADLANPIPGIKFNSGLTSFWNARTWDVECDLITNSGAVSITPDEDETFIYLNEAFTGWCAPAVYAGGANADSAQNGRIVVPIGGSVTFTRNVSGSGSVTVQFGAPPGPPDPVALNDALNNVRYLYPDRPPAVNGFNLGLPGQDFRDHWIDCDRITETATYNIAPTVSTMRSDLLNFSNCTIVTVPNVNPSIAGNAQRRIIATGGQVAYTNTATGKTLAVLYADVPAGTFALSSASARGVVGESLTVQSLAAINFAPNGFSIDPDLPDGLEIDPVTGEISGTPNVASQGQYAITASDGENVGTGILTLEISDHPAYLVEFDQEEGTNPLPIEVTPGQSMTLPTTNSLKSGEPFFGWYTDTAGNGEFAGMNGSAFTPPSSLTLFANWTPPSLGGSSQSIEAFRNISIDPWTTIPGAFAPTQFSVSPALPAGLTLDATNGTISGVATVLLDPPQTFTVTGSSAAGSASTTVEIIVVEALYGLMVSNGTGGGSYVEGRQVTIAANPAPSGQVFDQWTGDVGSVSNIFNPNATVTMPAAPVTLEATYKARPQQRYRLTVASGVGTGDYLAGQTISIAASVPPSGQIFDAWTGDVGAVLNANAANTQVIMPSGDITLTANYRPRSPDLYVLTVDQGTGGGSYEAGDLITVAANPAPEGEIFVRWTGDTQYLANANVPNTRLTMPASAASIAPLYEDAPAQNRNLVVTGGTGDGEYEPGRVVLIAADVREGYIFDQWVGQTAGVNNTNIPNTTLVMGNNDVIVEATFKEDPALAFNLTQRVRVLVPDDTSAVQSLSVRSRDKKPSIRMVESESVIDEREVMAGVVAPLVAPPAPDGFVFHQWVGQTSHVDNVKLESTYLYMPDSSVEVIATYQEVSDPYALTVTGGLGGGSYPAGEQVVITADAAPNGFIFERWDGQTASVSNVNRPQTELRMPATDVQVRAVYRPLPSDDYALTVQGGSGGGTYTAGTEVAISMLEAPPNQVFARWTGQIGTVADIFSASTTLYMPASEVTVVASFETPSDHSGLVGEDRDALPIPIGHWGGLLLLIALLWGVVGVQQGILFPPRGRS